MQPIYKIELDGKDITAKIKPYFMSLVIQDKEGEEADSCQLTLSDSDGSLTLPPKGKTLMVWIGFKGEQPDRYGPFITDYASQSGPPDKIVLMAHGADLRDTMKVKKTRHFDNISLGDLVATIAAEYNLTPKVHKDLTDIHLEYVPQNNINDLMLLNNLARKYGARVKPENNHLAFLPKGLTRSKQSPVPINKTDCITYNIHLPDRYRYGSVKARWYDINQAQYLDVITGTEEPVQVLSKVYNSESDAWEAAKAELRIIKKMQGKFFITTPMIPQARNESPVTLSGFKQLINDTPWVATNVKHTINNNGATSTIEGEIKPID